MFPPSVSARSFGAWCESPRRAAHAEVFETLRAIDGDTVETGRMRPRVEAVRARGDVDLPLIRLDQPRAE